MAYTHIFFDLDGTLTDSKPGIVNAIHYALAQLGLVVDLGHVNRFLGPPLIDSMQQLCGMDVETATRAVTAFRDYYGRQGLFENRLFDGIHDLLRDCVDGGKHCILATSKGEQFALAILEHFGIRRYFSFVAGAALDGTRDGKADVLRHALANSGLADRHQSLMVGDSKYDVVGAHAVGLPCAAVLYGYGSREDLEAAGAEYMATSVDALRGIVLP